jgi:hypothetical protein
MSSSSYYHSFRTVVASFFAMPAHSRIISPHIAPRHGGKNLSAASEEWNFMEMRNGKEARKEKEMRQIEVTEKLEISTYYHHIVINSKRSHR